MQLVKKRRDPCECIIIIIAFFGKLHRRHQMRREGEREREKAPKIKVKLKRKEKSKTEHAFSQCVHSTPKIRKRMTDGQKEIVHIFIRAYTEFFLFHFHGKKIKI